MKLNIDGAVFGSPGPSGIGICCRDSEGEFIFTFCKRLTNGTIDRAEAYAIVEGIEIAISRGFYHLWVESDSLSLNCDLFQFRSNTMGITIKMEEMQTENHIDHVHL
ncbi:hypothetical protein IFM89_020288 [Coptis chinensis]|uniref:RNase H type-1 domain-containing protein n=1 Tax=Coptis chinensis TaxID=261450 RepID=A0A835I2L0_9MAGN|nr:hypothetical protein IFM89_020288 [Coptis chinensis]